jgi:hypothetical protein
MNKFVVFGFCFLLYGCSSQDIKPQSVEDLSIVDSSVESVNGMSQVIENSGLVPENVPKLPPNSAELEQALKNMLGRMIQASQASDSERRGWVNGVYRVKKGDTISAIAHDSVKGTEIRADFMLDAIVKLNPSAFIRGNPNWMLAGAKLKFPSSNDFAKLFFVKDRSTTEASNSEDPFAGWIQYP